MKENGIIARLKKRFLELLSILQSHYNSLINNEKILPLRILFKKHLIETSIFMGCLIIAFWLELTDCRFHIDTTINFDKTNSLISTLSFAYIASYIFWLTNYFFKYINDIRIIYPQLKSITDNLLVVYDAYISHLNSYYKRIYPNENKTFDFNEDSLEEIIKYTKEQDVHLKELCDNNYLVAMQISYDIDLLLKYNIYLDTSFFSTIMEIGRNFFIIRHKQDVRNDLYIFECSKGDVMVLSKQVEKLREYTKGGFCIVKKTSKHLS